VGRVLVVIGVVLVLVGIGGAVASSIFATPFLALSPPDRAALCAPGERLVEDGSASTYTPGQGNRRSVRMFCVDDKGARREVTGDFVEGLIGRIFGSIGGLGSIVVAALLSLLAALGVVLIIVGAILAARRARGGIASALAANARFAAASPQVVVRMSDGTTTTTNLGALGSGGLASVVAQAVQRAQEIGAAHPGGGNLADRLRQLAEARAANLITQTEHDRLRDEILRAMRTP
jgi:hypothetical protein